MASKGLRAFLGALICAVLAVVPASRAQQQTKTLTNSDIIKMATSGLAESTILAVMQVSPANYDASPDALIAMKSAGVTQNVLNAVVAAAANKSNSPATPPTADTATPASAPGSQSWPPTGQAATANPNPPPQHASTPSPGPPSNSLSPPSAATVASASKEPSVVMLPVSAPPGSAAAQAAINLPLEKTQLSQTKSKASSLGGLANDSVTTQALLAGVNTVAWDGMTHSGGSMAGGIATSQAAGIFGSAMSHRKATVTYLWAIPGPSSPTQATSNQPKFSVNFAGWMYVSLDDFEPVIVKLTPTPPPNAWRLVGASQGKENAYSSSSVDWQTFSNFLQDQAPTQVKKISPGIYEVSASMPLEAGEYGIVLRPISKTMKFSGADVARNQGNGKVLNSVWTFEVK